MNLKLDRRVYWVGSAIFSLILLIAAVTLVFDRPKFLGAVIEPPLVAGQINLKHVSGDSFSLDAQRGKIILLFFGYTSCPDVCPTTLADMKRAREQLRESAQSVQFVFITTDPDRDNPQRIQDYASLFDPSFIGLSGSMEELDPIWKSYGVHRDVEMRHNSSSDYLVSHTSRIYLIDQNGYLRLTYSYGTSPENVVSDVRMLLK